MVRTPSFDKNGMKKGAWSSEEDDKLKSYILNYGHWNWRELPKFAGLKRCGKSCRLRWMNYLRPDLKHGNYTKEEDQLIIQLHQKHGNKWAEISSKLPGRTDNEIKNHWHTHLKKRVGFQKPAKIRKPASDDEIADSNSPASSAMVCGDHIQILESCPLSSSEMPPSSSAYTTSSDISSSNFDISNATDFFDDGGLEEMMNSADLFAEMSSLLSPMNQHAPTHHDHHPRFNDGEFGIKETPITMGDIYGEHDQDDLWGKSLLSDTYNEVLLSPCVNYYEENVFNLLFEQTVQEMP